MCQETRPPDTRPPDTASIAGSVEVAVTHEESPEMEVLCFF